MGYISLDIETVPLEIKHEDIKSYLMDKKISKEARSMDPNYSKIVTIGVKPFDQEAKLFSGDDEKKLLEEFWNFLKENSSAVFVTHNGYKFDVPFIILRSCANAVEIPVAINTNRWQMENSNHFDTMLFFSQYENFINPNLEILGKMHGIEIPKERILGSEIEEAYKNGEWEKIKERCKCDVELLEQLFKKTCISYLEKQKLLRIEKFKK